MDVLDGLYNGFQTALTLHNVYLCFVGCLWGTVVGVLPHRTPRGNHTPDSSHLWNRCDGAIIMLAGIYYGSMYGGSTTSILMNIPGESASVVTCIDGTDDLKGRGGRLFISAWDPGLEYLECCRLMFLTPVLANFAMKFGPPEMLLSSSSPLFFSGP